MKTYHYLIILAIILGGWYFYNKRKEDKHKLFTGQNPKPSQEPENKETTPKIEAIDLEKAMEIIEKAEECNVSRTGTKYILNADDTKYYIDAETNEALIEAGVEDKGLNRKPKK